MKALVVYGSRWGGTLNVAQKIGITLREAAFAVDVADAKNKIPSINAYDLIVVGSGIRADQWTKEALNFLERNAKTLKGKKTALFVSCQMADRKDEGREKARESYLLQIAEKYGLTPISYGFFGGYVDFRKSHGLLVDIIVRVNGRNLRKNGLDTRKIHDTRDWNAIGAWAHEVAKAASNQN